MSIIRILLTGHTGSNNRGCEAILRSTIEIINRYLEMVEFYLLSENPKSDKLALGTQYKNLSIVDFPVDQPKKFSLSWLINGCYRRILPGFPTSFAYNNRYYYQNSEAVLVLGGDLFTDEYEGPSRHFRDLAFARSCGLKTIIWAASIGPFHDKHLEEKWSKNFRKVDLITVRESNSLKYLNKLGIIDNVRLVSDPAFLLSASSKAAFSNLRNTSSIIVGIGMSNLAWKYGITQDKYISEFEAFSEEILSNPEVKLILIPHVVNETENYDDETMCRFLAQRLKKRDRIILIGKDHNASDTKYIISQCDLFIGARTHSTIASLSSYVPTISIAYSSKAHGINYDIFGHTNYVVPIASLNRKVLIKIFNIVMTNRYKIIKQLRQRIPDIKKNADKGGFYLKKTLSSN
ncbi:MAG: polysaccharide pyruvyl transferase family protein [Candidatus Helarchaeota archaeon]